MKKICSFLYTKIFYCCFITLLFADCKPKHAATADASLSDAGVSLSLATKRKALISNIHYTVAVHIPADAEEIINGEEIIAFNLASADDSLLIDFKNDSSHIKLIKVNKKEAPVIMRNEHIFIPPNLLKKGSNHVQVKFIAGNEALTRKPEFMYTLFVPERARTFMPCFDQPDLKAVFTVKAAVPSEWIAVSNGAVKNTNISGNEKTYSFKTSDTISTYLFSIVAGKFQAVAKKFDNRRITLYYRETDTAKLRYSLDTILQLQYAALQFMEKYTGILYPFQKLDIIALPDFQFGGMEHVGAIDYVASSLFLDKSATQSQRLGRLKLLSHEIAHAWFGDMVTMKWFNDVWMKEVFANFMADKVADELMPDDKSDFRFMLDHYPSAYSVDRTEGTHPIRQPLDNLNQAGLLYGPIIYDKAPIVLKQLEKLAGKDLFQKGAQEYLKTYAYKNAEWPDLIAIINRLSNKDITEWNDTWINKAGRPVISYTMGAANDVISKFNIAQTGEHNQRGLWNQQFATAFVAENNIKTVPVALNDASVTLKEAAGIQRPAFILFNASGEGYGLFPADENMPANMRLLKDPLMRLSGYINLYENVLNGTVLTPQEFLEAGMKNLATEKEELSVNLLSGQFSSIYWQFLLPAERDMIAAKTETAIWQCMQQADNAAKKRILFLLYKNIAVTKPAADVIFHIWKTQQAPQGVLLTPDDYTSMAADLAIRQYPNADTILYRQLSRITDADRRARFSYLLAPLSNNVSTRDSFFYSLSVKSNRMNEAWVLTALSYLHHPLRAAYSEKYLPQTLEWLSDVQQTGSVFFAMRWLNASFGSYQTQSAADVVHAFLNEHPDYNPILKRKIYQATDMLFRAEKITQHIEQAGKVR
ncbi:M1 family metallopeptidase [Parafilimonas sp.]|uniref:M1 family metallopeptidase n=1 Tax=Parafilimonas sp. TaxID=1969739 RepID=UPI0039E2A2E4